MGVVEFLVIALAGAAAGLINTVVGSGTLVTFPTLLAFGIPPVVANTSNSVGLTAGGLSGTFSMLPELRPQKARMIRLGICSLIGGTIGAILLLTLPSAAFDAIVPILIGLGCVLVVLQPWLAKKVAAQHAALDQSGDPREPWWTYPSVIGAGVYGGYFGAAQGVLLLAILGIGLPHESMARVNAVKNGLGTVVNGTAAVVFVVVAFSGGSPIDWWVALAIALGSIVGAQVGARVGRRLPPVVYRVVIVGIGVIAIVDFLMQQ
ncbi:sulfite exporter TauE/SafE family protein [Mariniluteicoccus endophyticus]